MTEPENRTRWSKTGVSGRDYAARFEALAKGGRDLHGEATFCAALLEPRARVLDAGCGTGRVAIRLAELGFEVAGVDVDASMIEVAREQAPGLTWLLGDLADLPEQTPAGNALVVAAGNVVPLLAPDTLDATVTGLTQTLAVDGLLVAGFGLDAAHLPGGCPVTPIEEYDAACASAGLVPVDRFATWDRQPWDGGGYAVSVHRREVTPS